MLALMMCDFANSWGLFMLVTEGPTFFWEVLGYNIYEVSETMILEDQICITFTSPPFINE